MTRARCRVQNFKVSHYPASPCALALLKAQASSSLTRRKETGVPATRARQIIKRHGAIEALSKLAVSVDLQSGFRILGDGDQLDSAFKALIVRHKALFRKTVVEAAQWRLKNAGHLR